MYKQLNTSVKLDFNNNTFLTESFKCTIGTRQGCSNCTTIFSLFINDLIELLKIKCNKGIFIDSEIEDLFCLLFADDVASMSDTVIGLQNQIKVLEIFCDYTGMDINVEKTKIIVFRNGGVLNTHEKWFYSGQPIEVTRYYKYSGTFFSSRLSSSKCLESQASQPKKSCMRILKFQQRFVHFNAVEAFRIFDAMVKPILSFGPSYGDISITM